MYAAAVAAQRALQAAWPADSAGSGCCSAVAIAAATAAATAIGTATAAQASALRYVDDRLIVLPSGDALLRAQPFNGSGALVVRPAAGDAETGLAGAEAARAAQVALAGVQAKHAALLEAHATLQARFDTLSGKHNALQAAHDELRKLQSTDAAEARAAKEAGEVKDQWLEHLKRQNEEWRSYSLTVLEIKERKKEKKGGSEET